VLLRDGNWPHVPGVCCWRGGARAAFAAAGAEPTELTWPPPARRRRARLAATLAGATLVVAESPAAAGFAVGRGVRGRRLWVLALPTERLFAGEGTGYAADLAAVAPQVGGFLADGEAARESVERATSGHRTRVARYPVVAWDRPCPDCRAHPAASAAGAGAEVAYLGRLRDLRRGGAVPPPPRPARQSAWEAQAPVPALDAGPVPALDAGPASAADQVRAARALLAVATPTLPAPRRPRSVLVAGYDLKFARELAERLDRRADLDVTVDDWPDLGRPGAGTRATLRHADAILAEWARTSAVWLSRRKRPHQFLAVRLHRFELDSAYPRDILIEQVDAVVYIAPLFGRRIRDELGWPVRKLVHVPNFVDVRWLDRPKLPGARFTLGLVGMEWSRKRFDLALDLLAAVRREDHRYRLLVRSVMPWQNPYVWARPEQRAYAGWCFHRIEQDPLLRDAVRFDPPGQDMARWYRQVGHLVSTSDEEGSHASVAEAMASGAVPVVRPWPGAAEVYHPRWVHPSQDAAVAAVLASAEEARWAEDSLRAQAEIRSTHDPAAVVAAWADLLHGDLAAARTRFPRQLAAAGGADGRAPQDHGHGERRASQESHT